MVSAPWSMSIAASAPRSRRAAFAMLPMRAVLRLLCGLLVELSVRKTNYLRVATSEELRVETLLVEVN